MSEQTRHHESGHEHLKAHENKEQHKKLQEQLEKKASEAHDNKEKVPELARKAKEESLPAESVKVTEHAPKEPSSQYVSRELKNLTFQRTLTHIRHKLSGPDKTLSKVIHQPVVKTLSKAGEQTIARPSGILGGSIFAFIGSTVFLYSAKHYGFRYNYLMFAIFFIAGFAVGLTVEMLTYIFRRRRLSS